MDFGYREAVLRPRFGQALGVLVIAICAIGFAGFLLRGDLADLLHAAFPLAFVAVGAWALFLRPAVRIAPADLELVNPLRSVRITWPAVEDIETRWSLVVVAGGRRFPAWAAPRESAIATGRRRAVPTLGGLSPAVQPASAGTGGALAGSLARRQWEEYRDRGLLGAVEGRGVEVTWHAWTIAVLSLLAVGAAATLALP